MSKFDRRRLAGGLAVVTGAGGGIGRHTAFALAEAGMRVVAVDRDAAAASRTAELAALIGPGALAMVADVGDEAAMTALAEEVLAVHGVPDVVVNNAGIAVAGAFLETSFADWRAVIDVNLLGVVHGCKLFGQAMVDRGTGGHLVNVASLAAWVPTRLLPAYCTSKAAVLMLSDCLRPELAPHGIGVSAICPGVVATGITAQARFAGHDEDGLQALRERATAWYRARDFGPEHVAEAIVRAIRDNADTVPVTPEAEMAFGLSRVAPGLLHGVARLEALFLPKKWL